MINPVTLSFIYISDTLSKTEEQTSTFLDQLQQLYPDKFANITPNSITEVYNTLLSATMLWVESGDKYATNTLTSMHNATSFHLKSNLSVPLTEPADYAISVNQSNKTFPSDGASNTLNINEARSGTRSLHVSKMAINDNDEGVLKVFGFVFHKISLTICIILVVWVSEHVIVQHILCWYLSHMRKDFLYLFFRGTPKRVLFQTVTDCAYSQARLV